MPIDPLGSSEGLDLAKPVAGLDPLNPDPNAPGPFKRGLRTGVADLKSIAGGVIQYAGRGFGMHPLEQYGQEMGQNAADASAPYRMQVEDVGAAFDQGVLPGLGAVADLVKYTAGNQIPMMATAILGGVVGRVGAGALGLTKAAAGLSGAERAAAVARVAAGTGTAEDLGIAHAIRAADLGAEAGVLGSSTGMELGQIAPEGLKPENNAGMGQMALGSLISGATDTVLPVYLARKMGLIGAAERALLPRAGLDTVAGFGAVAKDVGATALKAGAFETGQEGLQTYIERLSANQPTTGAEANSDYLNSAVMGGIMGVLSGGIAGGVHGISRPLIDRTPTTIDNTTGQPVGASEQVPTVSAGTTDPVALHAAASQQMAQVEAQTVAAQTAHEDLVAQRQALNEESSKPVGERRPVREIALAKKALTEQIKVSKAQVEDLGGQLHAARTAVAGLAAQLDPVAAAMAAQGADIKPTPAAATETSEQWHPAPIKWGTGPLMVGQNARAVAGVSSAIGTEDTTGLIAAFKGFGASATDDLYKKAFTALQSGTDTISGVKDPLLARVRPAFEAGQINSWEDIKRLENTPTPEQQTARAVAGARVAAGGNVSQVVTKAPESITNDTLPTNDLKDHIVATLAAKKGLSDAKKVEHANHIDSAIAAITQESAAVPENYREEFVKKEVNKRVGMRLDASVKGDIAGHILAQGTRETITPASDTNIGTNAAGESLYDRADGSRYRMSNGRPDFGGDLAPTKTQFSKGASEATPILARLATTKEGKSSSAKQRGFNSIPPRDGHTIVYKPYGNDGDKAGAGFYYVANEPTQSHAALPQEGFKSKGAIETKVVDDQGNPLPMYHGTDASFAAFDDSKLGSRTDPGFFGFGHYFVSDQANAQRWGKNVMAAHIELRNPLVVNGITDFVAKSGQQKTEGKPAYAKEMQRVTKHLISQGYDGVVYHRSDGKTQAVAFRADQIKPITAQSNAALTQEGLKSRGASERGANYDRAWKELNKLPGVNLDYLAQPKIDDLVAAAQLELDLTQEGEQNHTPRQVERMQAFVNKWIGVKESNAALTQDEFDVLPEPAKFEAVDAFNQVMRERGTALRQEIARMLGPRAGLIMKTFMATPDSPIGSYTRVDTLKSVITMALNAKDGLSVADHEGYHAAEDLVLTTPEVTIINNALKEGRPLRNQLIARLQQYDRENKTNLIDEVSAIPAEARAYAYEFWKRGELKADGRLAQIFQKLREFFSRIANAVQGLGFKSMEDIFTALDRGQFAERESNSGQITEIAGEFQMASKGAIRATQGNQRTGAPSANGSVASLIPPALRTLYSKAAILAERQIATRMEAGELERMQTQQAFLNIHDNAQVPGPSFELVTGLAKAEAGGLKRWWFRNIATPNYVSRFSQGYKNVQQTLNTYIRYRKILAEQMLREKLPSWYKAPDVDRKAAFGVMLKRTLEGYTKDSVELRDMLATLTPDQAKLYTQATGMIEGFLRAQFAKDQIARKTQLTSPGAYEKWEADRKAQVDSMVDKGYVPLRRYGDYSVRVYAETPDGKRVDGGLVFTDTERGAFTIAKMYQDEINRTGANLKVEQGTRDKNIRDTGISIEQFLGTLRRNGVDISQAERERLVLTFTNSESMIRNKLMHREGLPGYSEDSMRVLHEFGVNTSGELAYARFANAIDAASEGRAVAADVNSANSEPEIKIDERQPNEDGTGYEPVDEFKARNLWTKDGQFGGFYHNISNELSDYVLVPDHSGGWSRRLRAAAMVYFIGGSLSGAVVNAMSIPMMTVPELSIHTNYTNALTTTMGAWKDAWRHYNVLRDIDKMKDPSVVIPGISTELRQAIVAAADHIFDTEIHQMLGMSQGTVYSKSRKVQKAMEVWMAPFRVSEQTNRLASFIAAYRIGTENKLTGQELFKFASGIVDSTQNNYNESNRPGAARNPVFALAFMFKSFPLFMIEAISLMHKQNPKSAVYMLLGLTAMTGVQGLPFAETIEDLIDTIAQNVFGSPFNTRRAMRNTIKSASEAMTGADLSELVLRGAINDFVGVSASSRIGTGDFMPGTRAGTADADQGKILAQFLGAPYAMVHDAMLNVGKLAGGAVTGDWKQMADAIRAGGPIALRNAVKGTEQLTSGVASNTKGQKVMDVSTIDGILQLGGLTSAGVNKMNEFEKINIQTRAFYTQVSADMEQHLVKAMRENDTEKVQEINTLRAKWNAEYPTMPIMANAAATRRAIILAGVPLDQRSRMLWGRRIRGENVFSENAGQQ
jgi:hypothetical protein